MRIEFLLALGIYFGLLMAVALFLSRRSKNVEDFFLASRKLSGRLVYFSITASWLGAASTLVAVDKAFSQGMSSLWIMGLPAVMTVLVFAFFLARPIRGLPIISLPDLAEMRYGKVVRHITAVFIIWYMVMLAASQMVALGNFLNGFLGIGYIPCLLIGTGAVLLYSAAGGFFSVAITDGLQLILLILGSGAVFIHLAGKTPFLALSDMLGEAGKSGHFSLFREPAYELLIFASFTLAWIISPITWQRIQSARTVRAAQRGLYGASGTLFLFYLIVAGIGILSIPLIAGRSFEGELLSALISTELGAVLGALVFVAVASAVMSTLDTALNTGALSLTWDVFFKIFRLPRSRPITASRLSTVGIAILAFLTATRFQSILKALGLASEIMVEGLFIPGIAMIFLKRRMPAAGLLSLLMGGSFAFLSFLSQIRIVSWGLPEWPYSVPMGLALSAAGFAAGAVIDRRR